MLHKHTLLSDHDATPMDHLHTSLPRDKERLDYLNQIVSIYRRMSMAK
jgi:hypothetical protein